MCTIYLIRHGQASIGTSNYDVLSDLGRKQADILGKYLDLIGLQFDHVVSGTLKRQIDTACIATARTPETLPQNDAFNEYHHSKIFDHYASRLAGENRAIAGTLSQGHNEKLTYQTFSTLMNAWVDDNKEHGDLESWDQFNSRIERGLTDIIDGHGRDETIGVFTSGGVICTILQQSTHFPVTGIFELNWGIYNASISVLQVNRSTPRLRSYNSVAHLELKKDPALITNI